MNIVCCIDRNYVMPAGVLITSICINNPDAQIAFHIVCNPNVTRQDKDDLTQIVEKHGNNLLFYGVDERMLSSFTVGKAGQSPHITIATYYRLLLPLILPEKIDKILYLDADIIVRGNLMPFYDSDIEGYAVGAVTDMSSGLITMFNRLRYSERLGYFNAGVLLINLKYWREHNIFGECFEFAKNYPDRIKFHDQDILNYVLRERKKFFPLTYNFQDTFMYDLPSISLEKYEDELLATEKNPVVIHYIMKPWFKKCIHPYKGEFLKYKALTKWRKQHLVPLTFKEKIKLLLGRMGLVKIYPPAPFKKLEPLD